MNPERTLYIDCHSGISGDMFVGAAIDLGVPFESIEDAVRSLDIKGIEISHRPVKRCGFAATKFDVAHPEQSAHRHLSDIEKILTRSSLPLPVVDRVLAIFRRIAIAEARVHGSSIEKVHFHEVGAIDSIVDIVAASTAFETLNVNSCFASAIAVGCGSIKIAHGLVSLPAPATAEILKDQPLASTDVSFELTTPTGAAIVTEFAGSIGKRPSMTIQSIGYGAGDRDLDGRANMVRMFLGTSDENVPSSGNVTVDQVWLLETNLDNVPGEIIGVLSDKLLAQGALDVFTIAIQMKKSRPGSLLSILCLDQDRESIERTVFLETHTLGIRRRLVDRTKLWRESHTVATEYGSIAGQIIQLPDGSKRFSPENDSCVAAAENHEAPLESVRQAASRAFCE